MKSTRLFAFFGSFTVLLFVLDCLFCLGVTSVEKYMPDTNKWPWYGPPIFCVSSIIAIFFLYFVFMMAINVTFSFLLKLVPTIVLPIKSVRLVALINSLFLIYWVWTIDHDGGITKPYNGNLIFVYFVGTVFSLMMYLTMHEYIHELYKRQLPISKTSNPDT